MYLAPHVGLSGHLDTIPNGVPGTMATVERMRALVNEWRVDPRIIGAARSIVFNEPAKDELAEARALFRFVQQRIRYVRDVRDVETLATPLATLNTRSGDCDDHATLLAALLESIGFETRFVLASYQSAEAFEHVYLAVLITRNGYPAWMFCDSTERGPFGWHAEDPILFYVER